MANSYREYLKMKKYGGEGGDTPSPTLISKTINANGLYLPEDDQADGYNSVSVNVPEVSDIAFVPPQKFKSNGSNLEDYKIFGKTETVAVEQSGVLPLTFTTTEDKLRDWEIRGNDEPGTENLFDISTVVDGYINAYGVLTAGSRLQDEKTSDYIEIDGSTTYTFSAVGVFPSRTGYQGWRSIAYYDSNKSFLARTAGEGVSDLSATSGSTAKYARISYRSYGEANLQMMLVKGSTAPDHYIPYQQGVGERTENLLPPIIGANGWSAGYRNKVTGVANPASAYGEVLTPRITVGNSETFTIKAEHNTPPATGAGAAGTVYFFDNSDNYIGYAEFTDYSGAVITVQSGAASFDFAIRTGYVGLPAVEASDFWVELVKGSTAPATYIPYGYEMPISTQGENLFDISTMIDPDSAGKYLKNDGTTGNEAIISYTTYIPIAAQRVRLDNVTGGAASICCYDANKNFIRGQMYYQQSVILLNTSDAAFVRFSLKPATETNAALFGLNDYTFYIGNSPLTAGQSISKTSTGIDISTTEGENTISTTLYNKPETSVTYAKSGGVGEESSGSYSIPVKVNSTTTNVPIGDTPLMEDEYVSYAEQKIYRYVDGTLTPVDPPSALPQIATANGVNELSVETDIQPELVQIGLGIPVELIPTALGTKNITANDIYDASDDSLDGYSSVTVNVQPLLEDKTINENGTYSASSGYDGLGEVTVNVGGEADYVQDGLEIQSKSIGRGITTPLLTDPTQYKTIECCFKWDNVDNSSNMGRAVTLENSEKEIFAININQSYANNVEWKVGRTWTSEEESILAMPAHTYHTFSFVFFEENNIKKVSVYYDGAKVTTQNESLGTNNVVKICFKQSYLFAGRELDGNVNNFRVYTRALTDNEILLNYAVDQSRYV